MIIAGEIKVLCRALILPAFCVFMLQTLPLMGATFNSPVFNLQQNDVVYVEPNKVRMGQSTNNDNSVRNISTWLSVTSVLTSIAILIFR